MRNGRAGPGCPGASHTTTRNAMTVKKAWCLTTSMTDGSDSITARNTSYTGTCVRVLYSLLLFHSPHTFYFPWISDLGFWFWFCLDDHLWIKKVRCRHKRSHADMDGFWLDFENLGFTGLGFDLDFIFRFLSVPVSFLRFDVYYFYCLSSLSLILLFFLPPFVFLSCIWLVSPPLLCT